MLDWWEAICLYDDVIGLLELPLEERERLKGERARLSARVRQVEDEMIEQLAREGEFSPGGSGQVFYILAKREFSARNMEFEKKNKYI